MINFKYYSKGFLSIKGIDSPALALGVSFVAIGALLKNLGFTIQESILSTFLTYALPGSLVMAESMFIGASLLNIFLAVWLVNARLYPMTVSLMPLLIHKNQPRWKYYLSCHFIAVSSWLIMKNKYLEVEKEYRIDFWMGIGTATWLVGILSTVLGYIAADYLNKDMMIGLAIVNPVYFMCMMIGAMKTIQISTSIILGAMLGPLFYFVSPEWCILYGGFVAGTIAFFVGENNVD
ncbi:MAG TPA: branched-chain amino acid ABC transporter permease [Flavobacteriaceae bacterium]|jgi:predicted branched-subunit amino acid permease|nr:branched-chain amino acid ABC transporter permease [Flavobacteriaceae bacterium]|tara:strand:+ start:106 stop:810 length:705 start_codon:yes stop_codon:yes gene_type:complete